MNDHYFVHRIDSIELNEVCVLANGLGAQWGSTYAPVQLSVHNSLRNWSIIAENAVVTFTGGTATTALLRPVWFPPHVLYWAAERARETGDCEIGIQHNNAGDSAVISSPSGSGLFDLPSRPTFNPAWDTDPLPIELARVVVSASDLRSLLFAAGRGPRDGRPDFTLVIEDDSIGVGVDWADVGRSDPERAKASYRVPADTYGDLNRCPSLTLRPSSLLELASYFDEADLNLSIRADGSIFIENGAVTALLMPVGGPLHVEPSLADILRPYEPLHFGSWTKIVVDGTPFRLVEFPEIGHIRASVEIARNVEPTIDALTEINSLNTTIGIGKVVLNEGRLFVTTELPYDDVARLPEVLHRIGAELVAVGPLVAALGASCAIDEADDIADAVADAAADADD